MKNYTNVDFCNRTVLLFSDLSDLDIDREKWEEVTKVLTDEFKVGEKKQDLFKWNSKNHKKAAKKAVSKKGRLKLRQVFNIVDYIYSRTAHARIVMLLDFPKGLETLPLTLYWKNGLDEIVLKRKAEMGFHRDQSHLIEAKTMAHFSLLPTDDGTIRMANDFRKGDRVFILNNVNNINIKNVEDFAASLTKIGDTFVWDAAEVDKYKESGSVFYHVYEKYDDKKVNKGDYPLERDLDTNEILDYFEQIRQQVKNEKCFGPIYSGDANEG